MRKSKKLEDLKTIFFKKNNLWKKRVCTISPCPSIKHGCPWAYKWWGVITTPPSKHPKLLLKTKHFFAYQVGHKEIGKFTKFAILRVLGLI